ncbi:flavodoxin family protein [Maridesulfovibrio sp.]|uniref:flavodoxin family protein n=1 Tax=Maridesulfovibrio sp. TaxID=2795000 RepID=UPI002A187CDF|nr:flavodoxin family protein [Maridesulfovibrio sp.]
MKVTVVNGSARTKGNSHAIVNALCEGFAEGVEVKSYELSKMKNSGCIGCMSCKGKIELCVIKDDLTPVYEEMHESDVLVLASPVYFGDVSGQAKIFIDRLYHLFTPDFHDGFDPEGGVIEEKMRNYSRLKRGVKFVFITSQGAVMEGMYADIQGRYPLFFKYLGFDEVYSIRGLGDPLAFPEANRMEEALEQARELGRRLSV